MAKQVELKDGICTKVNKEDGSVMKYVTNTKVTDLGDRTLRFVFSDESIDRDEELILASGWRLDNYIKAPVILPYHDRWGPPVAKTVGLEINTDKELVGDVQFPTKDVSEQGDFLYRMYKNGFMFATSVGFLPTYEKMVFGDTSKGEPYVTFTEQELLEVSLVSVPSNPNALIKSKSFQKGIDEGKITENDLTLLDEILASVTPKEEKEVEEPDIEVVNNTYIEIKALDSEDVYKALKRSGAVEVKNVEIEDKEKVEDEKQSEYDAALDDLIEKMNNIFNKYKFEIKSTEQTINKCVGCGCTLKCPKCDSEDFDGGLLKKYFSVVDNSADNEQDEKIEDKTEGRYEELFKIIK